ncbi:MAG: M20 family metallopeptidase [Rubricoccaceae bacterium]|nr:M20 family metallopeptidase [Rubricoccaceae bacterium]
MTDRLSDDLAEAVRRRCDRRLDWALDRLRALVEIESPSDDLAAQEACLRLLDEDLARLGFACHRIPGRTTGGHLLARPERRARGRPLQLLLGHVDTVWPRGTLAQRPFEARDGHARGPGVFDMKAGLVQMLLALDALDALGLPLPATPVVFVNSDEEVGSPESTRWVERLARASARALVLEPGLGLDGKLKTARKGVGKFHVVVTGRASHAGLAPEEGASAILELSHAIQRLHALNDAARGVSVNVGLVEGGVGSNVVAPEARATVDVRVPTMADGRRVERAILGLSAATPGATVTITGHVGRAPMERTPRNQALWRQARALGRRLGLDLQEGTSGGASDGSTASLYTATLDGLGAVGDGAHAVHEFIFVDQMPERAALLALLLLSPVEAPVPAALPASVEADAPV